MLKGGILLAAYNVRRPTRDLDAEAVSAVVSMDHLRHVVADIVEVAADDGIEFDVESLSIREIREEVEYPGLRVRMRAGLADWRGVTAWDVSTGDPIVPAPHKIPLPRVHGEDIVVLGYRPETTIAEKGVSILERGVTSTRWRDYVDIVQLFENFDIDVRALQSSSRAVAEFRRVRLRPVAPVLAGYGSASQRKWAAWRRKEGLEDVCGEPGPPPHDIDVLVIGKADRADLCEAADRASARLGIEVNPVVRSANQWADPEDGLVKQIKASAHAAVLDSPELAGA